MKAPLIHFRKAKTEDISNLAHFFSVVYGPKHICTNQKYLAWFFQNPLQVKKDDELSAFLAEIKKGKIVGYAGCYPASIVIKDKHYKTAWLANFVTKKDFRGIGIGSKILTKIVEKYDLGLAASFSTQAYPLYRKLGWRHVTYYERFIKILNRKSAQDIMRTLYPNEDVTLPSQKLDKKMLSKNKTVAQARISWIKELDVETSKCWNKDWLNIRKRYGATTDRTTTYLSWRFFSHPFVRYKIALVYAPDKSIAGMLMMRIEQVSIFTIGRIVDIVAKEGYDHLLINAVLLFAKGEKLDALDCYTTFAPLKQSLKACDFVSAKKSPYCYLPELFNPLAVKSQDPIKLKILIHSKEAIVLPPSKSWHLVKADGDRDRAY